MNDDTSKTLPGTSDSEEAPHPAPAPGSMRAMLLVFLGIGAMIALLIGAELLRH